MNRGRRFGLVLTALLALSATAPSGVSAATAAARPEVRTAQGAVRGVVRDGAEFFGRLPYAAAPVGPLRWRAPQVPPTWPGVRDAATPSPACAQSDNSNGPETVTEDCLYVDVWRPAHTRPGARLPVLYWIFGGGGINGSASQYNAAQLAQQTHTIVVTVNHRLGWLGFLANPVLSRESSDGISGQYGFLDQIAGLRWTQRTIRNFGGDPAAVTVAGQSAGGRAACRLLAAPPAAGLFRAAIIESGACDADQRAPREAQGQDLAAATGCGQAADVAACLRDLDVKTLIDRPSPPGTPVVGGAALPEDPRTALPAGRYTHVPVLVGNTHDENRPYPGIAQPATADTLQAWVRSRYPAQADEILRRYSTMSPPDAAGAIASDPDRVCRAWTIENTLAASTSTYAYEFADATAPAEGVTPGFSWGAYHTTELEYLFRFTRTDGSQKFLTGLNAEQQRLAQRIRADWGFFVHTATVPWPRYSSRTPVTQQFKLPYDRLATGFAADHRCGYWQEQGLIKDH